MYLRREVQETALSVTVDLLVASTGFPIGMVNILDADTQHTLVASGVHELPVDVPRARSLCDAVLRRSAPLVVPDLAHGAPPDVDTSGVRAFVGVPLHGREGLPVGTLCLFDRAPRDVSAAEVRLVERYADVVRDQLELLRSGEGPRRRGLDGVAAQDVQDAVSDDRVVPWYQTLVDVGTGQVVGVEALARWDHPELGVLPPSAFLPVAERSDLVVDIDLAVLDRALRDVQRWRADGVDLRLNVNLSGRHLAHDDCVERFRRMTAEAGVPASVVNLELTESTLIAADEHDIGFLNSLRADGFQLWLDDFGSGWSSLRHLVRLPADGIKLDQGMAGALGTVKGDAVVRAMTRLAADTGLGLVVEGVESEEQRARALDMGCRVGQGYLWSKPAPAEEVTHLLAGQDGIP